MSDFTEYGGTVKARAAGTIARTWEQVEIVVDGEVLVKMSGETAIRLGTQMIEVGVRFRDEKT